MEYAYRFRIHPNSEQENQILRTLGCCRYVFKATPQMTLCGVALKDGFYLLRYREIQVESSLFPFAVQI